MERHGVVVYVLAFSVDGRPRFAAVIRHFAVVTGNINTVKLMLVSEYFLIVVRTCATLLHLTF